MAIVVVRVHTFVYSFLCTSYQFLSTPPLQYHTVDGNHSPHQPLIYLSPPSYLPTYRYCGGEDTRARLLMAIQPTGPSTLRLSVFVALLHLSARSTTLGKLLWKAPTNNTTISSTGTNSAGTIRKTFLYRPHLLMI